MSANPDVSLAVAGPRRLSLSHRVRCGRISCSSSHLPSGRVRVSPVLCRSVPRNLGLLSLEIPLGTLMAGHSKVEESSDDAVAMAMEEGAGDLIGGDVSVPMGREGGGRPVPRRGRAAWTAASGRRRATS